MFTYSLFSLLVLSHSCAKEYYFQSMGSIMQTLPICLFVLLQYHIASLAPETTVRLLLKDSPGAGHRRLT